MRLFSLPLPLSPSTGDLASDWAAFVGWPSSIKDGHFVPSRSGSHSSHTPSPLPVGLCCGHAARCSAGALL